MYPTLEISLIFIATHLGVSCEVLEVAPMSVNIKQESVQDYYDILEMVGSGGSGAVHRCREKNTGTIFAAKIIRVPSDSNQRRDIRREIAIMSQLHHPNLLCLHHVFLHNNTITLIVEFLPGGRLSQKRKVPEIEAIGYVRQICGAIKYMHERKIYHCDICPENILCRTNFCTELRLIDFGMSVQFDPNNPNELQSGFVSEKVGHKADMWSIGDISYYLLSGKYPFTKDETLNFHDSAFHNVSVQCIDFIERLLGKDDRNRMNIHEALNHPWLTGSMAV